eukprot:UN18387
MLDIIRHLLTILLHMYCVLDQPEVRIDLITATILKNRTVLYQHLPTLRHQIILILNRGCPPRK